MISDLWNDVICCNLPVAEGEQPLVVIASQQSLDELRYQIEDSGWHAETARLTDGESYETNVWLEIDPGEPFEFDAGVMATLHAKNIGELIRLLHFLQAKDITVNLGVNTDYTEGVLLAIQERAIKCMNSH